MRRHLRHSSSLLRHCLHFTLFSPLSCHYFSLEIIFLTDIYTPMPLSMPPLAIEPTLRHAFDNRLLTHALLTLYYACHMRWQRHHFQTIMRHFCLLRDIPVISLITHHAIIVN